MPRTLFPTKQAKAMPEGTSQNQTNPERTGEIDKFPFVSPVPEEEPENTKVIENAPENQKIIEEKPEESPESGEAPEGSGPKAEMPLEPNSENMVTICGQRIEIKPTKVTYFRNHTATTYNLLRDYPLTELMNVKKGVIDEKRDGDQILYDFIIACLDDKDFVKEHYNEMNADEIEQIIKIVGRLNHTDEKVEQLRKNREAQGSR